MIRFPVHFIAIFMLSVLLSSFSLSAQPSISPELIQKYQSMGGANLSPDQIQQAINHYQKPTAGTNDTMASAKENLSDSTIKSVKKKDSSSFYSMYEMLLRGINLYPDSILAHLPLFGYEVFSSTKPSDFFPFKLWVCSGGLSD